VDLARALAFLAMVSVHLLPLEPGSPLVLLAGRAAALFVVLTGVSAVLSTSVVDVRSRLRLALRGVLVALLGLALGAFPTSIAVILTTTGALLVLSSLLVGLRARTLALLAPLALVSTPVLSQLLRPLVPAFSGRVPAPWTLDASLPQEVLLTGYYPVLTWSSYLVVGLLIGRLLTSGAFASLRSRLVLVASGAFAAVLATISSSLLARPVSFYAEHLEGSLVRPAELSEHLVTGFYGTVPTSSWSWLLVDAPHSGTPFDLVGTAGSAALVLGLMLLVPTSAFKALTPLTALGATVLTSYSAHVVMTSATGTGTLALAFQVVLVVLAAWSWSMLARRGAVPARGPLEHLVTRALDAAVPRRAPQGTP
jgi:hypothetical protein